MFHFGFGFNRNGARLIRQNWWKTSSHLLDGTQPKLDADFSRQRYMLNGVAVPFSSIITLSSAGKWVVNSSGVLVNVPSNTPAFDYSTGRGRLVLEGASTNIFLNSATGATQSVTTTATTYTLSFWGTGNIVLSGTASGTLTGTGANNRVQLTTTATAGTLTLTVSGSCTNVQIEAQPAATSYIPTTSSAVARTADRAQLTSAAAALLQGTVLTTAVRGQMYAMATPDQQLLGCVGTTWFLSGETTNLVKGYTGSITVTSNTAATGVNANFGVVFAGNNSGSVIGFNGGLGSLISIFTPSGLTTTSIYLGAVSSGYNPAYGYFDEFVIWPNYGSNTGIQNQARVWS